MRVRIPAKSRLNTGTANNRWSFGKCASNTQQIGIEIAPMINVNDAKDIQLDHACSRTVK